MEEKSSFYDFLVKNMKLTQRPPDPKPNEETKPAKISAIYLLLSWASIILINSFFVWIGWNEVISKMFSLNEVTLFQSVLLYLLCKVILRGIFSAQ